MSPWSAVIPAAVAIVVGLTTVRLLWASARALAIIVLALALAAALAPLVRMLERRLPRPGAVVLVYAAGAVVAFTIGWLTVPSLVEQLQESASRAPEIAAALQARLQRVLPPGVSLQDVLPGIAQQATGVFGQVPMALTSFVFELLVIVFLSMYVLIASPQLQWFLVSLFPRAQRRRAALVLCRIAFSMGGYFRAVAIDAFIIGGLTWLALSVIGLEFALPLAALAGAGEFVPYLGPVVAAIPAIGIALLDSVTQAVLVGGIYLGLQQLESHVVTPLVMRSQTDIRPATVIVALTLGYAVGGVLGAIVAIPLFAGTRVLLIRVVAPAIRRASRVSS